MGTVRHRHFQSHSHVQLFEAPWTVAHQASLSVKLFRQKYWSGLPFPIPEHVPDPGIKPTTLPSSALAGRFYTTVSLGTHINRHTQF